MSSEFIWTTLPEPHRSRNKAILAKYGKEIKQLMGNEPLTLPIVLTILSIQLYIGLVWVNSSEELGVSSWKFWVMAYVFGATISQALFLAIHELAHNSCFSGGFVLNRMLALVANFPIIFPFAVSFKGYHMEHHRYQGDVVLDQDLPTPLEAQLLEGFFGKLFFMTFQILFYALRPPLQRPQPFTLWHAINAITQLLFVSTVYYYFGTRSLLYFLLSALLAGSLHPCAAHFISEHYTLGDRTGKAETFSYYGPLNYLTFNVGYHVEHHDFPNIPWSRLPLVRKIAPEFYDDLPKVDSWVGMMVQFLFDPTASLYDRIKRKDNTAKPNDSVTFESVSIY